MTNLKNLLLVGGLAGSLALTGCDETHIKKVGDLTGDSIQDVLMYEWDILGPRRGNYLFIGKKNGEFIRAKEACNIWRNSLNYFETENSEKYFFDGKFYRLSPKQKE